MLRDFDLLGFRVRDKITNFVGVVTSISYDLYGCIQALVTPTVDNEKLEVQWFDSKRLEKLGPEPVMPVPKFEEVPGGQKLPPQNRY